MKILFVAVFDDKGKSSNNAQAVGLEKLGHDVVRYNYRIRAGRIGPENRDQELVDICRTISPDAAIFSKTNTINLNVFEECKKICPVCYWFPDPLQTFDNPEFLAMTKLSDVFCCDKKNVMEKARQELNENSFVVFDGYDPELEYPKDVEKDLDVSFIGSIYGDRLEKFKKIKFPCAIAQSAYGDDHSIVVSRSKINLNFCTSLGASDRTYKVMAAGGFYLTDDWIGRDEIFVDGEHLVIYKDMDDLNEKIANYLANEEERERIAAAGMQVVQPFSRYAWAESISDILENEITKRRQD